MSVTAFVIIAQGTTSFLMIPIFGNEGQTDFIGRVPYLDAGWLSEIPLSEIFWFYESLYLPSHYRCNRQLVLDVQDSPWA